MPKNYNTKLELRINSHELGKTMPERSNRQQDMINSFNICVLKDMITWEKPIEWFWETLETIFPSTTINPAVANHKEPRQAWKAKAFRPVSGRTHKECVNHETY